MNRRAIMDLIGRARAELEQAARELEQWPDIADHKDAEEDLVEIRARVNALELRVAAIEERDQE